MCRLAYIHGHAPVDRVDLNDLLNCLVADQGGHGCGHAILKGPKLIEHRRGLDLTPDDQIDSIMAAVEAGRDVVWHTRLASVGVQCDRLCHPFKVAGGNFAGVVVHNGTWAQGRMNALRWTANDGIPHSDTEWFAQTIAATRRKTLEDAGEWPREGVWIVAGANAKGKHRRHAYYYSGSFARCMTTGVYCSRFPHWWSGVGFANQLNYGEYNLPACLIKSRRSRRIES